MRGMGRMPIPPTAWVRGMGKMPIPPMVWVRGMDRMPIPPNAWGAHTSYYVGCVVWQGAWYGQDAHTS